MPETDGLIDSLSEQLDKPTNRLLKPLSSRYTERFRRGIIATISK